MRKVVQKQIMKKPLFALAIIAFGIGIAWYTNASFKEGNASMGATGAAPPPPAGAAAAPAASPPPPAAAPPAAAAPAADSTKKPNAPAPGVDVQALLNSPAVKTLLGNAMGSVPAPNSVQPKM